MKAATEASLVKAALDLLSARGVFAWRNNTGMLRNATGRPVKFGKRGSPDIVGALPNGRFIGVEVKRPGKQPTDIQAAFLLGLQANNAVAIWIDDLRTLDRVLAALDRDPAARFTIDGGRYS